MKEEPTKRCLNLDKVQKDVEEIDIYYRFLSISGDN